MYPTYIQPPLEFKHVDSTGIPSRAKFWPSKKPCQTYLLFIPGNPGIISYYDEFLTALHVDSPSTTILGISLAGHEDYEVSKPLSLAEQIDHKVRIVDTIISSPPFTSFNEEKPRLVIMGHSVGAYMAWQVLKQRPQNVDNVFLLFPALSHIGRGSVFGKVSSILTAIPGSAKIAAWIVLLLRLILPIPLLAMVLRLAHTLPGTALSTTLAKFFNPSSVESFSHLAKYEFKEIRELDVDTLVKYAKRVTAYYAVKDRWVPNFAREQIMKIINDNGGDAILCNEGFPHAFSLVHGPQMAKKISLWISTLFHPLTQSPTLERDVVLSEIPHTPSWTPSDQDRDTLVNTTPENERRPDRKASLGAGVVLRERMIRDLE